MNKKIIFATDHAGYDMKEALVAHYKAQDIEVEDCGAHEFVSADDYPDIIRPAVEKIVQEKCFGVILGGSGQGEAIVANRIKGARAAVYYAPQEIIVRLARRHNSANILSIGARTLSLEEIITAIDIFINEPDGDSERHKRRIKKIDQ